MHRLASHHLPCFPGVAEAWGLTSRVAGQPWAGERGTFGWSLCGGRAKGRGPENELSGVCGENEKWARLEKVISII